MSYHEGHGQIYKTFGISEQGCVVVLRPDQYISYVGPMDDVKSLNLFFSGFMVPQTKHVKAASKIADEGILATSNGEVHSVAESADGGIPATSNEGVLRMGVA